MNGMMMSWMRRRNMDRMVGGSMNRAINRMVIQMRPIIVRSISNHPSGVAMVRQDLHSLCLGTCRTNSNSLPLLQRGGGDDADGISIVMLESCRRSDVQLMRDRLVLLIDFGVGRSVREGNHFFMMSTRFQFENTVTCFIGTDADDGPDQGPLTISTSRLFHSLSRFGRRGPDGKNQAYSNKRRPEPSD